MTIDFKMPTILSESEKQDRSEQTWKILKAHILRERARKKQEREAEVEEERLRKEREARERQDVMTLEETKEQLHQLEKELKRLRDEKHKLFLQLKKVLNEDDMRKKQKENVEVIAVQGLIHHQQQQQLYTTQNLQRNAPPIIPQQQSGFKPTTAKRPRSPSPPLAQIYQSYAYKPQTLGAYQQKDDGRRHELVRAVLWNKTPQYGNQPGGAFYSVPPPPQDLPIYYPLGSISAREATRAVYERPQAYHIEQKISDHYTIRTSSSSSHGHVMHGSSIPINHPVQPPPLKAGSITLGYPVPTQQQYQQQPGGPAASLYTTQNRPLYQSPPGTTTTINYHPPRD